MRYLDLTLPTPAENLALDEALLEEAESAARPTETLRIWEPSEPMVVVGRSSQAGVEVRLDRCCELGIPVLRRTSGGAAIVTGPVRRLAVGDPDYTIVDVIAGKTLDRLATISQMVTAGEVVLDESTALSMGEDIQIETWQEHSIASQTGAGGGIMMDRTAFTPTVAVVNLDTVEFTYEITINEEA